MASAQDTAGGTVIKKLFSNDSTFVNWVHVGVIAPGLVALKRYPQYLQWMPAVGGVVAAVHLFAIAQKRNK